MFLLVIVVFDVEYLIFYATILSFATLVKYVLWYLSNILMFRLIFMCFYSLPGCYAYRATSYLCEEVGRGVQTCLPALQEFQVVYVRTSFLAYKQWKTHKISISDQFLFFYHLMRFDRIWYNGLDLNRFCAPDRIIEKSISTMFLHFDFFGENVC